MNGRQLKALPRELRPTRLREAIGEARAVLRAALDAGQGGLEACAGLSGAYDDVIRACWSTALAEVPEAAGEPLSLVATGGWGREHMCPYSDIDFIVLTKNPRTDVANAVAASLLYPLWDAGIQVGHAVRSPKDAV